MTWKQHSKVISSLRWIGFGAILLGLLRELCGMEAGAVAPMMRKSQQQMAEAGASAGDAALEEGLRLYKEQTAESFRQAIVKLEEARQLFRIEKNTIGEAITLFGIGSVYDALGEKQKALDSFAQALPLSKTMGDRNGEAATFNNIGSVYSTLGEKQKALDSFAQALPLFKVVGNRKGEATTFNNIGSVYDALGEKQKALDSYAQALPLSKAMGDRNGEATTLNNIGRVYSALGEKQKALDSYAQALLLKKVVGNRDGEATTLNNIGGVYSALGEKQKALIYFAQALPLFKVVGDRNGEAATLNNIGLVYSALGEKQKALDYLDQVLPLSKAVGNRDGEAATLTNIGSIYNVLGEKQKALDFYAQALPLFKAVGDRSGEATTFSNLAYTYREQGKLELALEHNDKAIAIIEDLRLEISSKDLRASYFATVQDEYQFKTDLLMQLHQKFPNKGYEKQAFETSDRGRARSLIELLTESGIALKPTTENTPLFKQERKLQQSLRQIELQRVIVLSKAPTPAQAQDLERQSEIVLQQLQDLTVKIRAANPAYAALKYPQPLMLAQIQKQVLDKDTLLLQYSLGEKQSYLWAVTANGIQTYTLPPKAKIENIATFFRNDISTDPSKAKIPIAEVKSAGDALYQLLLAPAAKQLPGKRLLIVADGALQTIPFAALPLPNSATYNPLLKEHEIINAPSAASVAVLRQKIHSIGPKALAVIADPVFQNDDKRLSDANITALDTCAPASSTTIKLTSNDSQRNIPVELQSTLRSFNEQNILPLPNTRLEAEKILALVPPDERSASCAFAANYGRVMQLQKDRLDQYRIVHFATHGYANESKPQFSGLLLSLVDSQRRPQNGFLRLHDIFNLHLAADLVVLSACETGLGKDIRGEGLVGLTRGFIYAGSRRVVTSLWQVTDETTGILMADFYQEMLQQKQTPPAALRAAQLKMWSTKPDPYLWAAFTLQGEWRP